MLKDWVEVELGDVTKFIDYRGRTPAKTASGIPLITAKNVRMGFINEEPKEFIAEDAYESWMTRGIPQTGDILFTTEAPLGYVAQLKTAYKIALAQRLITFQPINVLNNTYLSFCLMSPQFQNVLNSQATGTTVKGIKAAKLKLIKIPLAPLPEQRAIASKIEQLFSELDNGIANLKTAKSKLEIYRQAILKQAFEGKLTNPKNKLEDDLPSGGTLKRINSLCEVVRGGSPRPAGDLRYYEGNIPFLKVADKLIGI